MSLIASEVVKVYDLEHFAVGDNEFLFRLEVHRRLSDGVYFPKLFQFEFHRVAPTFPQDEAGEPKDLADIVIMFEDHMVDLEGCEDETVDGCVRKGEAAVRRTFELG